MCDPIAQTERLRRRAERQDAMHAFRMRGEIPADRAHALEIAEAEVKKALALVDGPAVKHLVAALALLEAQRPK